MFSMQMPVWVNILDYLNTVVNCPVHNLKLKKKRDWRKYHNNRQTDSIFIFWNILFFKNTTQHPLEKGFKYNHSITLFKNIA